MGGYGTVRIGMKRGVVIVMNPQTGEVLAMVSLPTYDNNKFAEGISRKDFQALPQTKATLGSNFCDVAVVSDPRTELVTFTGGETVGKKIAPVRTDRANCEVVGHATAAAPEEPFENVRQRQDGWTEIESVSALLMQI